MNQPKVSVVVTTKNNQATLDACLRSIALQTYLPTELIVVDNDSTDDTLAIAVHYTNKLFTCGPERSAQRNFGAQRASGKYLLIVDSDMELGPQVVEACVAAVDGQPGVRAAIIPEESFGVGFWARCKQLERSFYVGVDAIEAARFFSKRLYRQVDGYNEQLTGGEDWDLTRRIRAVTGVARAKALIRHNEGRLYFGRTARKLHYYARHASAYVRANPTPSLLRDPSGPLARYRLFLSQPGRLLRHPLVGMGMLFFKTTEYAAAGFGYLRRIRPQAMDAAAEGADGQ